MKIISNFDEVTNYYKLPISQYARYLEKLAFDIKCGKITSKEIRDKSTVYDYGIVFKGSYAKGRVYFKRGESANTNQDLSQWFCILKPYFQDTLIKKTGQGLNDFRTWFNQLFGINSSVRYVINTEWV